MSHAGGEALSQVNRRNIFDLQDVEELEEPRLSPFHGHRVPHISMRDYVMRISKYSKCSNICCVMAYSYIQRLGKVHLRMSPAGTHNTPQTVPATYIAHTIN